MGNKDFQSFTVTVTPTLNSAICVQGYNLTVIEAGVVLKKLNIDSNGSATVGGLDLCRNIYNFAAIAVNKFMDGGPSVPVEGQVDFSG